MKEKHLILDFNFRDMKLNLCDISRFNVDTILDNIDRFNDFIYHAVMYDTFDLVFETEPFQLALLDDSTNYIENLVCVYNAIIDNKIVNEDIPHITNKELTRQMRIRGFRQILAKIRTGTKKYMYTKRFVLDKKE